MGASGSQELCTSSDRGGLPIGRCYVKGMRPKRGAYGKCCSIGHISMRFGRPMGRGRERTAFLYMTL